MIDEKKLTQYGMYGLTPKGIVIHNTNSSLSAQELFNYLNGDCTTTQGCHFIVDDKEVISVMPEDWKTWSTGKGNDYAFENCLAIEICDCDTYEKSEIAESRGVLLIKELMEKYNLTKNELYFHIEFNQRTYCPHLLLDKYKTKKNFVERNF